MSDEMVQKWMGGERCPDCDGTGHVKLFTTTPKCKRCEGHGTLGVFVQYNPSAKIAESFDPQKSLHFVQYQYDLAGEGTSGIPSWTQCPFVIDRIERGEPDKDGNVEETIYFKKK